MSDNNRPRAREKHVTGEGKGVHKRGAGTGQGQVGSGSFMSGGGSNSSGDRSSGNRSGGGLRMLILLAALLLGGGGGVGALLGGSDSSETQTTNTDTINSTQSTNNNGTTSSGTTTSGTSTGNTNTTGSAQSSSQTQSSSYSGSLASLFGGYNSYSNTSAGWTLDKNTAKLNTSIAEGSRDKYTTIYGDGSDEITIMVYMCGTDLESRSGMATNDLTEMTKATIGNNINLIVFAGGCSAWKNNVISSNYNQIYQIRDGGLKKLVDNAGNESMTNPDNLTYFIDYCKENYPANRNMLIFWDHGGGSVSGYGYDEKNPRSGSMSLSGINTALKNADMKFDFIGFDTCLMATIETDLMLTNYADYCIASEETEPGVGWYYTNWLTALSENPSMSTLDIGKNIIDDFVDVCARSCPGQKTTLSIVDLAELETNVPEEFKSFAQSTTELIKNDNYNTVSTARSNTREFASSSKIDQIDLVNFANGIGTDEASKLVDVLLSSVKYNRTSDNMTNAYGISAYFPYKKASLVDQATNTYDQIGLDSEYSDCIKEFAALETSGQIATGGSTSPFELLLGDSSQADSALQSLETISQLITLFAGSGKGLNGLDSSNMGFMSDRMVTTEQAAEYISANQLDAGALVWQQNEAGDYIMSLPEDQWNLIHSVDLNVFYDDGEGYVDMGLDNLYSFDDDGNLVADVDGTWISINDQPVAYYHTDTTDDGENYTITGYVPAMLNDKKVHLILIFDNENPYGYIAGADPDYDEETETSTISRGLIELEEGDTLDFICDYYSYDGTFNDSYYLGNQMTVTDEITISNTVLGEGSEIALYKFTDIYNQSYWSDSITKDN
ncbi:MAG: peptidase C11 [Butyrivibrio sp.]|nr:peptidase C11 [Butyrivibrio sp.]